jgi:hypothetical protein
MSILGAALGLLATVALAKEKAVDEVKAAELYDTGIIHNEIMEAKMVSKFPRHDGTQSRTDHRPSRNGRWRGRLVSVTASSTLSWATLLA